MTFSNWLKKDWPSLVILAAPFIALPFLWAQLPDQVPMHWNIWGEVDSYGSKTSGLLFLPFINILLYALLLWAPKLDPKERLAWDRKPLPAFRFFMPLIFLLIHIAVLAEAMGVDAMAEGRMVMLIVSVLLLVIGNYLSTIQPNYFVGVRTPWTLEDPEIWRRTHRLAGRLWVTVSALLIVLWLVLPGSVWRTLFFGAILIDTLVPLGYSYYLYATGKRTSSAS